MKESLHINPEIVARRCAVKSLDYRQLTPLDWIVLDFADGLKSFSEISRLIPAEPDDISQKQYIHVFAVDKANNVSEEYIIPFADTELKTNITTDKKLYAYGDKVEINADTVSAPFGEKADMKIEI